MKLKLKIIFFIGALVINLSAAKFDSTPDSPLSWHIKTTINELQTISHQLRPDSSRSTILNTSSSSLDNNLSPDANIARNPTNSIPYNFPLGWYDTINKLETPALIANEGINLVIPYTGQSNVKEVKAYLDRAATAGIKMMVEIPRYAVIRGRNKQIVQFVRELKSHPAIFGWYLYDEPTLTKISSESLARSYQAIKAEDPEHTVAVAFNRLIRLSQYSGSYDIAMYSKYPAFYNSPEFSGLQNGIFKRLIETAASLTEGRSDFWFIIQGYGENKDGKPQFNRRVPTAAEEKYMVYTAILNKADGLFFWAHYRARQKWIDSVLTPIITELQSYLPAITNNALDNKLVVDNAEIQAGLYQDPTTQDLLLIAINHSSSQLKTAIAIEDRLEDSTRILTKSDGANLDRGILSDTFEPYAVHIYQLR